MRELFIYWRTADPDAAAGAVRAWQAELRRAFPALQAALYHRADAVPSSPASSPSLATMMETYAGAAIDAALEQRLVSEGQARLKPWLAGERVVEVFVRLPPA